MTEQLEHQLLQQAQTGDYDAFEQLYGLLESSVRRFVRRLTNDSPMEDDIMQMTFISLYRNLHRIDPIENLRPYVFKIARNRCYDVLRSQGRFKDVSLDEDESLEMRVTFASTSDNHHEAEDAVGWLLLHLEVQQAMEQLPELQRQSLILYSEEQLSYSEIAIAMDTNIGTVKSRVSQARKNLRRLLKPQTLQALDAMFTGDDHVG